ncbi:MAG TPA: APH(3') family aminoglycoside O-phosphotransferase, partial [Gemmatimonadaceae bacterium]|nr:APH(3') family aminoglycoside O-phosphotransferase [Gemmatimonadaceae bacterium]
PPSLQAAVHDHASAPVSEGESGAIVHQLTAPGRPVLYLKHGAEQIARDIVSEFARLDWLADRLPVARVRHFVHTTQAAWLLTDAVAGQSAYSCLVEQPERGADIVEELVRFMRMIHGLPITDCPFHAGHRLRMADAWRNVTAGRVDTDDFDEARRGWTAEQVRDRLEAQLPPSFAQVVTHGDFTLDNVMMLDGRVTGCLDVGRVGVADPYQDLALLWNSLAEFGDGLQTAMFRAYGIDEHDERKLQFHLCLDELF